MAVAYFYALSLKFEVKVFTDDERRQLVYLRGQNSKTDVKQRRLEELSQTF
jgi:hypothetical protein